MPSTQKSANEDRLSLKQTLRAIFEVLKISFSISPVAIAFKLFNSVLDAVLPLAVAYFAAQTITSITNAFNGQPGAEERTLVLVVITAVLGLVSNVKSTITSYIDQLLRFKVEARISDMLYERFVTLDFWRYDDKESTDLYEKATDFTNFFVYVFDRIANLMSALFGLVSALIALSLLSSWLAVILSISIVPGMFVQYKISRFQIKHWRKTVTARRKQSFIEYNMMQPGQISELRLYNLAQTMLELRKQYRNQDQGARLTFERKYIKVRVMSDLLTTAVELGSLIWIVLQIADRLQPIGQFIYVQQLVSRAIGSADRFISEYGAADEDLAKLKDYTEFMSLPVQQNGTTRLPKKIDSIEFKNVSFTYPNTDRLVLSEINMTIQNAEHIAIVGENGAGKSTLIKLLLGFYVPTAGAIYINNVPLQEYRLSDWHKKIGVLLQDFTKFYFTDAKENIVLGNVNAVPTPERISQALEAAEATNMIKALPKGLHTPMATWYEEEGGTELSGGQWQRLALARNFYRKTSIVVLDEPTSAIDALAEAKIFDKLFNKRNKNTLIAISHRLTTIENADCIYVLKNGKIVQNGTHKDLAQKKGGEYEKMFRRHLKKS